MRTLAIRRVCTHSHSRNSVLRSNTEIRAGDHRVTESLSVAAQTSRRRMAATREKEPMPTNSLHPPLIPSKSLKSLRKGTKLFHPQGHCVRNRNRKYL